MTDEQLAKAQEIKGKIAFWEEKILEEKKIVQDSCNLAGWAKDDVPSLENAYLAIAMYGASARMEKVESMIREGIASLQAEFDAI